MKKYEMFKEDSDDTLYRIRALRSFVDVKKGDVGGFIEKESNLSQEGDCWLYDNAKVYENAQVFENAKAYDNATIFGYTKAYGNAKISGSATVCRGEITDKVIYMSLPKDNLTVQGDGYVMIGCEYNHIDQWIENYEEICRAREYTDADVELYGSILKALQKTINLNLETIK